MSVHDPQPSEPSDFPFEGLPLGASDVIEAEMSTMPERRAGSFSDEKIQRGAALHLPQPGSVEESRGLRAELETSRAELLVLKEELATLSSEVKARTDELADVHADLSNLMASTEVATVFLNQALAVKRYTPGAAGLFNLDSADVGRSLGLLRHRMDYPGLPADAEEVLRTLVPMEREVRDEDSRWLLVKMHPYRTLTDQIGGVVLTLEDVTERKDAAEVMALDLEATTRLSEISLLLTPDGDFQHLLDLILDSALAIMHADAGTLQLFDPADSILRILSHRGIPEHVVEHFAVVTADSRSPCGRALEIGRRVTTLFDASLPDPTGDHRWHREEAGLLAAQSTPLVSRSGRVLGMLSTHWRISHFPNDRQLRFFDILARLAADAIERRQADETMSARGE